MDCSIVITAKIARTNIISFFEYDVDSSEGTIRLPIFKVELLQKTLIY